MPALALGDEQSVLAGPNVLESQAEDLAAAQPAEQHRFDHRPVPARAQRRHEQVDLVRVDHAGQGARRPDERHPANCALAGAAHRQAARHRVARDTGVAADDQVLIEACDRRQPALDRASRQACLAVLDPHDLGVAPRPALLLDEREHVGGLDVDRVLVDDREEHLQVERSGQHRVPTSPSGHQLDIRVEQRMTETDHLTAGGSLGADQARHERHEGLRSRW